MWSAWSRYWLACSTTMLRWYLGYMRRMAVIEDSLETRVGRDGARWAILSSEKTNVIHVQRRARGGGPLVRPPIAEPGNHGNVVPFMSTYLRRATHG